MPAAFPHPLCPTCGEQPFCRARGHIKADYPHCHRPLLGTRLDRAADLIDWWSAFHGYADPRLAAVRAALLERLAADRWRYSEVFEPSWSRDPHGWHFWRFSYALPGFRDAAGGEAAALALCQPFGDAACGWARTLLAPAGDAAVMLPLVGVAYDGADAWRLKIYLQFHDDAGDAAWRIARRLVGRADLHRLFAGQRLHLLGIDLGPHGIAGAKLYLRHPKVALREVSRLAGPVPLLDDLAAAGRTHLRNLLVIHRLRRPDDPALATPAEVDFALGENELLWDDLEITPALRALRGPAAPVTALTADFEIAVRRVSVPVGRADKLNVYYVPTVVDAADPAGA